MYLPKTFEVHDDAAIDAFMERYGFATVVTTGPGLLATHLPVVAKRTPAGLVIVGHFARANPHWRAMDGRTESLVIFQGPHGYISPTWYSSSPAVPTWNYAVVHACGRPRAREDPAFIEEHLRDLVRRHEDGRRPSWRLDDVPADYRSRLIAQVVAFEMHVERLEAKFKLSQNRDATDRGGVIAGLEADGGADARALAAFMRARLGG